MNFLALFKYKKVHTLISVIWGDGKLMPECFKCQKVIMPKYWLFRVVGDPHLNVISAKR